MDEAKITDAIVVSKDELKEEVKGETVEEKYRRVGKTIETILKGEGLQMDVFHQVFFRPIQESKPTIMETTPKN